MNNLQQAEELKEKTPTISWWENELSFDDRNYLFKEINYETWIGTIKERHEKLEEMFKVWKINKVQELKAKIEAEGCGIIFKKPQNPQVCIRMNNCPDCQEAIKICEEILK